MAGSINTKAAMGPVMEFVKDHEREIAEDSVMENREPRPGLDFGRLRLAFFQLTGRWPSVDEQRSGPAGRRTPLA